MLHTKKAVKLLPRFLIIVLALVCIAFAFNYYNNKNTEITVKNNYKNNYMTKDINTVAITIYSKAYCPYCVRAKALLDAKGLTYNEILVDQQPELLAEMLAKSQGLRTVPQIFLGDHHVGGFDNLSALQEKGELDSLLKKLSSNIS